MLISGMHEFQAIEKYFLKLTQGKAESLGLRDDAAVLAVPNHHELVVTSDTLNAGTHFPEHAAPDDIACKALRVNLSDLAAMGARPYAYQLNIAFPSRPEERWLAAFTDALLEDQNEFGIFCSGGDTTSIKGPLSISITALGLLERGRAYKRSGGKEGDQIILTHPVGDAWIGLQVMRGEIETDHDDYFIERYYRPSPRFVEGNIHAAIDISDGLIADLKHICAASGLAADIQMEKIQFSTQAQKLKIAPEDLLSGGDDYELLLAVSPQHAKDVLQILSQQKLKPQIIGSFSRGEGVRITHHGKPVHFKKSGWTHF